MSCILWCNSAKKAYCIGTIWQGYIIPLITQLNRSLKLSPHFLHGLSIAHNTYGAGMVWWVESSVGGQLVVNTSVISSFIIIHYTLLGDEVRTYLQINLIITDGIGNSNKTQELAGNGYIKEV